MSLSIDSLVRVSRVNGRDLKSDRIQREGNELVIEGHGYRLGRHVEALNVSGGLVANSDQWQQVIERVRRGDSAGAAVNHIHRLSRDVKSGLTWVDDLGDAGGVLIGGGRVINLANPHERHMLISELNNGELALNIYKVSSRETMTDVKKRGILNRLPFGYLRADVEPEPKKLVKHPDQAPVVKTIYLMRGEGKHWPAIIAWLHDTEVRSPKGHPFWTESTLLSMVKNRVYRGEVKMGDHITRKAHDPIVTDAEWKAAQPSDKRVFTNTFVGGVAYGLVSCSGCDLPLQVHSGGKGNQYLFYGCRRKTVAGRCPAPVNGAVGKIDAFVDRLMADALDGEELDVVNAKRDLTVAKQTFEIAQTNYDNFFVGVRGMSSDKIHETLAELEAELEQAKTAYNDARFAADAASDLPESGADYLSRPLVQRQRYAKGLIAALVLDPFPKGAQKNGANPADRLRWTLG